MRKCLSCGPQICSRRPQPTDAGLRNIAPRRLDLEPPTSMDLQSEGSSSASSCAYVNKTRVVPAQPGDFISARVRLDALRRPMMRYPYTPGVPRLNLTTGTVAQTSTSNFAQFEVSNERRWTIVGLLFVASL